MITVDVPNLFLAVNLAIMRTILYKAGLGEIPERHPMIVLNARHFNFLPGLRVVNNKAPFSDGFGLAFTAEQSSLLLKCVLVSSINLMRVFTSEEL